MATIADAKNEMNKRGKNNQQLDDTYYFHQRALLQSVNLSVGILITAIMIFRMKNSNV